MELNKLSLGDSDEQEEPPWDSSVIGEGVPAANDNNIKGDRPKSLSPLSNLAAITEEDVESSLEILEKAANFKKLELLSGNSMSSEEVTKFISDNYGSAGLTREAFAKYIMEKLGYTPAPDVLLMLSCTKGARVVIATAGAGKTTSLQLDIVISKLISQATDDASLKPIPIENTSILLPRVLYLNYNKHNVYPAQEKHKSLCVAVNKLFTLDTQIDDLIDSATVHSFCLRWLKAFSEEVTLPELEIMDDDTREQIWEAIITPRWKKYYDDTESQVNFTVLDELYVYKTESMLDWDPFFECAKFVDTGLKPEFAKACIKKYDSMKRQMQKLDFTDYLVLMTEVLRDHPELKERLQKQYSLIIADENQDFTKLMNELLLQLYTPGVNKLVVVGDPDQTIYAFKGVSPDNVVDLYTRLEDKELLGLDVNYRCPDTIIKAAKAILDLNILRFEKPIKTVKTGGKIITHPISLGMSQDKEVLQLLQRIPEEEYSNTVVTFRNNVSSIIVAEEMYYAGIPFTSLDASRPFTNPVFKQITSALRALRDKDDYELNCGLYRFLPMTKNVWMKLLDFNRKKRRMHLHDLQLPRGGLPSGSIEALKVLGHISEQMDEQPVCDYIDALLQLYKRYHFRYLVEQDKVKIKDVDKYGLYLDRTEKFYKRQMTFKAMMAEFAQRNKDNPFGITLSTFHGLKGLEFNYVIALDFVESIFPNFYSIEQSYTRNTAMQEKESENRLCYVLVTRTIKELHLFYLETDPSVYVGLLSNQHKDAIQKVEDRETLALGRVVGTDSTGTVDSKLTFVQRMLKNRR